MPAAPGPFPQGGLRVTHCDEEEDTEAGPGPGWAALVSLLGSQPPRQVQETDRQGAAGLAPEGPRGCSPQDSGRRERSRVVAVAGGAGSAGVGWGQLLASPSLLATLLLLRGLCPPHAPGTRLHKDAASQASCPSRRRNGWGSPGPRSKAGFTIAHAGKGEQPRGLLEVLKAQGSAEAWSSDPGSDRRQLQDGPCSVFTLRGPGPPPGPAQPGCLARRD